MRPSDVDNQSPPGGYPDHSVYGSGIFATSENIEAPEGTMLGTASGLSPLTEINRAGVPTVSDEDFERRLANIELAIAKMAEQRTEDHELLVQLVEQLKPIIDARTDHENRIRALESAFAELRGGRRALAWAAGLVGAGGGTVAATIVEHLAGS